MMQAAASVIFLLCERGQLVFPKGFWLSSKQYGGLLMNIIINKKMYRENHSVFHFRVYKISNVVLSQTSADKEL
jgi:hypothetical protein